MTNLAQFENKNVWFRHSILGDASFDTFKRHFQNPLYKGSFPFEWPVNGTLFKDPISQNLYVYITLYYKGYWPPLGAEKGLHCIAYKSVDNGLTWIELGTVLEGRKAGFDCKEGNRGGAADMCVVYDQGVYHSIYGWVTADNKNGGIAYATSSSPEEPFVIHDTPLHIEEDQSLLLNRYKRMYSSSLIKRKRDWLIIAMMSTPRNAGGTWALVYMRAEKPEGPYSAPQFLIYPQSKIFHPPIMEFFPAFEDDDYIFCPFTSVALNRNFQIIYRALKEDAHLPEAWEVYKYGSVWHAVDVENEKRGIWGQAFSGVLDGQSFKVIYPSKTSSDDDKGTINLAECQWDQLDQNDSFYLSAPNGPAITFIQRDYSEFSLVAQVAGKGKKIIFWAHRAPVGPDITSANATLHPIVFNDMIKLEWGQDRWDLKEVSIHGECRILSVGSYESSSLNEDNLQIVYDESETAITINGHLLWRGKIAIRAGRIGLLAETGSNLQVSKMNVEGDSNSSWLTYVGTEGLIGAGEGSMVSYPDQDINEWKLQKSSLFRYGFGYITNKPASLVKWNYLGSDFKLWSPKGPDLGKFNLYVDGTLLQQIDLYNNCDEISSVIYESQRVSDGNHAITLQLLEGKLTCDSLDFHVIR